MDIRCPKCGEPWEMDSLHDEVAARFPHKPWKADGQHDQKAYEAEYLNPVKREFYAKGCPAMTSFGDPRCNPETMGNKAANAARELYGLFGDDLDGVASELDDLAFMGYLD